MDSVDLLLNPVRIRIVNAMTGGRMHTTSDLCARLSDVPRATVYRHVALLAEAEVLEVVDERRVRGAVERSYRLRSEKAVVDRDLAMAMSLDDHRRGFTGAMAALLAEFNAYLERDDADPPSDFVSYKQGVFWLTQKEIAEMVGEVRAVFAARATNQPDSGRHPHLVSLIMLPTEEPANPD